MKNLKFLRYYFIWIFLFVVSNLSFGQNIKETSADKGFNIPYMIHQNCPEIEEQTTLGKCSLKELRNWLYRKTDFSINKFKNGSYRCIIKFQIDAKGSVSRLQIRSQDKNFQQELEKAFKKFPSTFRAVDIDGNVLNTAVGFTLTWVVSNQ